MSLLQPINWDAQLALIKTLREEGKLTEANEARRVLHGRFPLTEELWLDWLRDELPLATDREAKLSLFELFKLAVTDYLSPALWTAVFQWALSELSYPLQ